MWDVGAARRALVGALGLTQHLLDAVGAEAVQADLDSPAPLDNPEADRTASGLPGGFQVNLHNPGHIVQGKDRPQKCEGGELGNPELRAGPVTMQESQALCWRAVLHIVWLFPLAGQA